MFIKTFVFNPFYENTYIIVDQSTNQCAIIDPGNNEDIEDEFLERFISSSGLQPVCLINTHCHIDHILGNSWVSNKYDLELQSHEGEVAVLSKQYFVAETYGIKLRPSPQITHFLKEDDIVQIGSLEFKIIESPGHSPASICLYNEKEKTLIAGDVLFKESIGRTDLPGGDHDTLLENIRTKIFTLPDNVMVYPGHGETTTIGHEKKYNPFLM